MEEQQQQPQPQQLTTPPPTTATTTTFLPFDIITQILIHLPPKPLTRCKLLSKPFLNYLSTPHFPFLYSSLSPHRTSPLSLISLHPTPPHTLLTLHLPTPNLSSLSPTPLSLLSPHPDITNSCHGIILLTDFPSSLFLINPLNKSFHVIPLPADPDPTTNSTDDDSFLLGSGKAHWADFGLGLDPTTLDFKILRIDQHHHDIKETKTLPRQASLYSMQAMQWKKLYVNFPYFLSHPMSHGKYLCGCLHWIATTSEPPVFNITGLFWRGRSDEVEYDYLIVKFDFVTERFSLLKFPALSEYVGRKGSPVRVSIQVVGERLVVEVENGPRFRRSVDVWVMEEYGNEESWVKVVKFEYQRVRGELLPVRTLAVEGEEERRVLMQQGKDLFWVRVVKSGEVEVEVVSDCLPVVNELVFGHGYVFGSAVSYVEGLIHLGSGESDGKGKEDKEEESEDDSDSEVKRCDFLSAGFKSK